MSTTIIKPSQIEAKPDKSELEASNNQKRELILELGRRFGKIIETFFEEKKVPAELSIIYGGLDYVIRFHKERRDGITGDYLQLKKAVESIGLKVHEPFNNDNIPVATDYFKVDGNND